MSNQLPEPYQMSPAPNVCAPAAVAWSCKVAMLLQLPRQDVQLLLATQQLLQAYRAQTCSSQQGAAGHELLDFFVLTDPSAAQPGQEQELRLVLETLQCGPPAARPVHAAAMCN
jgi:hypothetical protein